jgi:hypothetical protein
MVGGTGIEVPVQPYERKASSASLPAVSRADGLDPLLTAIEDSIPLVNLRLRSETVDQDGLTDQAEAVTLRSRLGFETGKAWDTSLLAEADLMWPLDDQYNGTINHRTEYPTVSDPEDTALDRLQLMNTSLPATAVIVGRQRINLDDQRFIGSVDFRQNEQTFDSASIINSLIPKVTIDLTYLDRANRIYGTRSPVGRFTGDSYLGNISYDTPFGKLTGFDYFLAFDQDHPDSTHSVGVCFAGAKTLESLVVHYAASYADQKPYADNTLRFDNDYYAGEVTATLHDFTAGGGTEVLGGNGVKGFTTPLATLHKFDGWADEFLTTPANGLQDRYAKVAYLVKRVGVLDSVSATAVYHDFRSDRSSIHYGTERDLMLLGRWRRYSATLAYADYSRDQFGADTRKLWAELDYVLNDN